MLHDNIFNDYLAALTTEQKEAIRSMRGLIFEICPTMIEAIDQGKWFGGLLVYNTPEGLFAYALGPRGQGSTTFHMHPYYESADLQQRHGTSLKKFLTGKSCIRFQNFDDLPMDAMRDILSCTGKILEAAELARAARKK